MNNYEYIIASLPVLQRDSRADGNFDAASIAGDIRSQLSGRDRVIFDFLMKGFDSDNLDSEFYTEAMASRNGFISGYFSYDLLVRNTRTAWLNSELKRPGGQDMIDIGQAEDDPEQSAAVYGILSGKDILERERGLDSLMWDKIDELTEMKVFDLDVILGFAARMKIVDRWIKLDPETGKLLFRRLVEEIRTNR